MLGIFIYNSSIFVYISLMQLEDRDLDLDAHAKKLGIFKKMADFKDDILQYSSLVMFLS